MLILLLIVCPHWWIKKITVNNKDTRQIITVCFKLGHKTKLSDPKWNITLHKVWASELALHLICHDLRFNSVVENTTVIIMSTCAYAFYAQVLAFYFHRTTFQFTVKNSDKWYQRKHLIFIWCLPCVQGHSKNTSCTLFSCFFFFISVCPPFHCVQWKCTIVTAVHVQLWTHFFSVKVGPYDFCNHGIADGIAELAN